MTRHRAVVSVLAIAGWACAGEIDDRQPVGTAGQLAVYDALAPASPAPDIASLYFTVINFGARADTLEGIDADVGTAQLHNIVSVDGRSVMQHVHALEIPPGDTVRLAPGGYHVMLMDLAEPLALGDTLRVTLVFSRGGPLALEAPVLTYTEVIERLETVATDIP